jgi:Arylsulfatase regulator (Fe-S oxidoreductase)
MKWSKYNYLFITKSNKNLLYNSITNNFVELDTNQFNALQKFKENPNEEKHIFSPSLISSGFIVENDKDLYYSLKLERQLSKFDSSYLALTIVPTAACNFNCSYCYETDRPEIYMDDLTENKIIEFIKSYSEINRLRVTWYGGEPLLAFDRIVSLTKKIKALNINYEAYMISNGYLLNNEVIEQLEDLSISGLQITLDGLEEMHNKRRPHLYHSNSFQIITQNLDQLFKKNNTVKVALRVNIDKTNEHEYPQLHQYLTNRYNTKKLNIHPGYVTNIYSSCSSSGCEFDREKKNEFVLDQFQNHNIPMKLYPSTSIGGCTARHINSFVIGAKGELYKCWNDLGIKDKEIGNLHDNEQVDPTHLVRYLVGADQLDDSKCQNCFFFPICNGGCPYSRIANEFDNKNIDCCHVAKNNIESYLELHYENCIKNE